MPAISSRSKASRHQSSQHHNPSSQHSHQNSQHHEQNTQYIQKHHHHETHNSNGHYGGGSDENNDEISIVDETSQAPYEHNNNNASEYYPLYQKQSATSNANSVNAKQSIVAKNRHIFAVKLNSQTGHSKQQQSVPHSNSVSPQMGGHHHQSSVRSNDYAYSKNDDYLVNNFRPFSSSGATTPTPTSHNHHYHPSSSSHMHHQPMTTTMSGVSSASSNTTSRYYRHLSNYVSGDLTSNMTASKIAPYASEKTTHVMKYGSTGNSVNQYEPNPYHKSNVQISNNNGLTPSVYSSYTKQHGGFELTSLQQPQMASYAKKFTKNSRDGNESANNYSVNNNKNASDNSYDTKRQSGTTTSAAKSYGENSELVRVGSTMLTSQVLNGNYTNNNNSNRAAQYLRNNANNGYNSSNRAGSTSSNSNYDENELVNANDLINGKCFFLSYKIVGFNFDSFY
jgi:hypothetical protein